MDYRKIYIKIINNAKKQNRSKSNGYFELHHILPKSLFPLWKNRKSNKVLLTAREHFFCHQLLAKIYPCKSMLYALHAFISRPNADYKISSREYQRIKENYALMLSKKFKGRKRPKEEVDRIVATRINNHYTHSEETRRKISEKNKGRKWTKEQREKRERTISGREKTEKEIYNQSQLQNRYLEYLKNGGLEKQREVMKKASEVARLKNMKSVICVETNETFDSIKSASKVANADGKKRNLSISIKKGYACANGLHFKLLSQVDDL